MKKNNKQYLKKTEQELQEYLAFRRRGYTVPAKKGKGSYKRSDFKKEEIIKKHLTNSQECAIMSM